MNDLISIIVPCYNIEEYLEKCVISILNQTYKNIEVLLVDDGSQDRTGIIIERMAETDSRIVPIHKSNGGVTRARMEGIKKAKGTWIGFVDGDDYIEPDMYEILVRNALTYNADISHCGYQMVFPDRTDFYYQTRETLVHNKQSAIKELLEGSLVEPGLCNKLFHRKVFCEILNNNILDFSIKNMEDLLMNYYLFRNADQSVYEGICPYHYMVRKGSASTGTMNEHKLLDPLRVFKVLKEYCSYDDELKSILNKRIAYQLIFQATLEGRNETESIQNIIKNARIELRELLPEIFAGKNDFKLKGLVLWAALAPGTYRTVHVLYARIKGTDKKYVVQ